MSKKPNLQELEQKIAELTDALQRERADALNLRRRTDEERSKMADFYKAMIIQELLPAIDNLERAISHTPKELADSNYAKGVQSVLKQFEQGFAGLGVKRIRTVGEVFDPKLHEAVHMEDGDPSTSSGQADLVEVVCEELQPGYRIGDEIIRHAKVKVRMQRK